MPFSPAQLQEWREIDPRLLGMLEDLGMKLSVGGGCKMRLPCTRDFPRHLWERAVSIFEQYGWVAEWHGRDPHGRPLVSFRPLEE